jgi:two-component system nitrate/nitrite response regulator NarL
MRVLVVAADPLARAGIASMIAEAVDVVGAIGPGEPALPADAVLYDTGAGDVPERFDGGPIVALVGREDVAAAALIAGARAVIWRTSPTARIVAALNAVVAGLSAIDDGLWSAATRPRRDPRDDGGLTPRELEVLRLLADGLSNKLIADRLDISEHTAKFHVVAIFGKLGVTSRTEAVVEGLRRGLVLL